jgi:hypothetical protein
MTRDRGHVTDLPEADLLLLSRRWVVDAHGGRTPCLHALGDRTNRLLAQLASSMTVAITAGTWLHEGGDWQFARDGRAATMDDECDRGEAGVPLAPRSTVENRSGGSKSVIRT